MRWCWNWQTGMVEGHVAQAVGVRFPPSAQQIGRNLPVFCLNSCQLLVVSCQLLVIGCRLQFPETRVPAPDGQMFISSFWILTGFDPKSDPEPARSLSSFFILTSSFFLFLIL